MADERRGLAEGRQRLPHHQNPLWNVASPNEFKAAVSKFGYYENWTSGYLHIRRNLLKRKTSVSLKASNQRIYGLRKTR